MMHELAIGIVLVFTLTLVATYWFENGDNKDDN